MNEYSKNWDKLENNKNYIETADIVLQDRKTLLNIMNSFFLKFIINGNKKRILDLGTGDGVLVKNLYSVNKNIDVVVTDGSQDMLENAKENLKDIKNIKYICITFEDIIDNQFKEKKFDFIVSSFAIHHLLLDQKKAFFKSLYNLLNPGGYFINIDTVSNTSKQYNKWYIDLWVEWIKRIQKENNLKTNYENIAYKASDRPENHYDPLDIQLQFLKDAGFSEVECHYKYGLFAIYSGKKYKKS